jgi:hypothetical protein
MFAISKLHIKNNTGYRTHIYYTPVAVLWEQLLFVLLKYHTKISVLQFISLRWKFKTVTRPTTAVHINNTLTHCFSTYKLPAVSPKLPEPHILFKHQFSRKTCVQYTFHFTTITISKLYSSNKPGRLVRVNSSFKLPKTTISSHFPRISDMLLYIKHLDHNWIVENMEFSYTCSELLLFSMGR